MSFLVLLGTLGQAQSITILKRVPLAAEVRGAAQSGDGRVFTWGRGLTRWTIPAMQAELLADGEFGEGGCLVDLDNDGKPEFVAKEGSGLGKLTWRRAPYKVAVVIDDEIDTHDCIAATLFGRKGVLVVQRYMQVRFYERSASGVWKQREIYSIYTPSQQAGLLLRDVDEDGRVDIVCGNYWIQSPAEFSLPWRIFAINTYFDQSLSAMLVHCFIEKGFIKDDLFVAQAHMQNAKAALFHKPADPRQLWTEKRLDLVMHRAHAAAVLHGLLFFAENNGSASRTFVLEGNKPRKILDGIDTLQLLAAGNAMLSVGPRELALWRYRRK